MALLVFRVWLARWKNQMCHLCVGKNCFPMRWQKNKKYISFNNLHLLCSPSLPTTCYLRNKSTTFVYTRFITFVYPYEIGGVYEAYFEYVLLYLYLVNNSNYVKKPKLTKIINRMK